MRFSFPDRGVLGFVTLIIYVLTIEGRKHHSKRHRVPADKDKEDKSTFITIRIPAHVATRNQDCLYEGNVRHHGDAWSPGPCIPECRCRHGHVECSKLECPDLNCAKSIKKKWKCCPECLPGTENGTSCGVWTKEGNANGGCCVFPFHYNDVMYYTCTYQDHDNPWCSITMNFDRDGVWGECIDKGKTEKLFKSKHHKKKHHKLQGQADFTEALQNQADSTDALVASIANNVGKMAGSKNATLTPTGMPEPALSPDANNAANGNTSAVPDNSAGGNSSLVPAVVPESNVSNPTTNTTEAPLPSAAPSNGTIGWPTAYPVASGAAASSPAASGILPMASSAPSAPSNVTPVASPVSLQPSPASTQPLIYNSSASAAPASNETSLQPGPAQSSVGPSIPQATVVPLPATAVAPAASPAVTPVLGSSVAFPPPSQPVPQPAPQPQPGQPVLPGQQGATPTPTLGATGQLPVPTTRPETSGTPSLFPYPAEQPAPGAGQQPTGGQQPPEGQKPTEEYPGPWPASQTTLSPGQSVPGIGLVQHQLSMTEVGENHNVSTTEYWFGQANETLNRTGEIANQTATGSQTTNETTAPGNQTAPTAGNETAGNQTAGSPGNETTGNQTTGSTGNETIGNQTTGGASTGNQTAGSAANETAPVGNETAVQNETAAADWYNTANSQKAYTYKAPQYTDQQSDTQRGYYPASYNTQEYNGYNDYPGYQQYGQGAEARDTAGQPSYYNTNEQQYQNTADQGSYYAG